MVLLLLVIVAQFTLTLSRHPSLRLCHLVCVVGSRRIALVLVEALDVGRRVGAGAVVLADRVVALGAAHALLLCITCQSCGDDYEQDCIPKSGYGRGPPPIMGMDSRRLAPMGVGGKPGPKGLPLLARFSMARSTSVVLLLALGYGARLWLPWGLSLPRIVALALAAPTIRSNVPSNCEAKALATSLLTVELVPISM